MYLWIEYFELIMFGKKKDAQLDIDVWKMENPLFIYKLNNDEIFTVQSPENELEPNREMEIIRQCIKEYPKLLADPQVRHDNIFPHYIIRLLTKRHSELTTTIKILNGK